MSEDKNKLEGQEKPENWREMYQELASVVETLKCRSRTYIQNITDIANLVLDEKIEGTLSNEDYNNLISKLKERDINAIHLNTIRENFNLKPELEFSELPKEVIRGYKRKSTFFKYSLSFISVVSIASIGLGIYLHSDGYRFHQDKNGFHLIKEDGSTKVEETKHETTPLIELIGCSFSSSSENNYCEFKLSNYDHNDQIGCNLSGRLGSPKNLEELGVLNFNFLESTKVNLSEYEDVLFPEDCLDEEYISRNQLFLKIECSSLLVDYVVGVDYKLSDSILMAYQNQKESDFKQNLPGSNDLESQNQNNVPKEVVKVDDDKSQEQNYLEINSESNAEMDSTVAGIDNNNDSSNIQPDSDNLVGISPTDLNQSIISLNSPCGAPQVYSLMARRGISEDEWTSYSCTLVNNGVEAGKPENGCLSKDQYLKDIDLDEIFPNIEFLYDTCEMKDPNINDFPIDGNRYFGAIHLCCPSSYKE